MASVTWAASSRGTNPVSVLSTALNALANGAGVLSGVISNTTERDLFADFELFVGFASAPTALTIVELYIVPTVDGANYDDTTGTVPPTNGWGDVFPVRAQTAGHYLIVRGMELPPQDFKVFLRNSTGQAFAATLNTLKAYCYKRAVA
jgi:hypothetical protein